MGHLLEIRSVDANHLRADLPGGGELQMERLPDPLKGLLFHLPNGSPKTIALLPGQESEVWLNRTVGRANPVPYPLGYERDERDGQVHEWLGWRPTYHAEGKLKIQGCEVGISVFDYNGDGLFDRKDYRKATTLGLDLNGDGRIFGAAEWRNIEEIVDVCGLPLEVAALDPAGLSITFRVSEVRPPALNAPIPAFSVLTTKSGLLRSGDFRGRIHVLDFWASWCAPCVAKLAAMEAVAREYSKDVTVVGINVDQPERRATAEQIVREQALSFPQVIRAQGTRDFLWKMFGSMAENRLAVPLYVVVDRQGLIRYADSGGEDLGELKGVLRQLIEPAVK